MDVFRKIRRSSPALHAAETVKNMVDEKSVIKGVKKTLHEDICEDSVIGAAIYNSGHKAGYRKGYEEASRVYETKLHRQAQAFFDKTEVVKVQLKQYQELLKEYEKYIEELETENQRTKEENALLKKMLADKRRLESLKIA